MNSRQLTPDQLRTIEGRLRPMLGYLSRLERRMEKEGFPLEDRLYRLTRESQEAVQALTMAVHYGASTGVGQ